MLTQGAYNPNRSFSHYHIYYYYKNGTEHQCLSTARHRNLTPRDLGTRVKYINETDFLGTCQRVLYAIPENLVPVQLKHKGPSMRRRWFLNTIISA